MKVINTNQVHKGFIEIEAMRMMEDGYKIYISENGVYLVDEVPVKYIKRK
jgi:RNA:NAD 2'-phosphotransferase (TPT1/KptA family)